MRVLSLVLSAILSMAALSVPASAAPAVVGDPPSRAAKVRISLEASSAWVKKNRPVTLSGRVRGVRGKQVVTIWQKRTARGYGWVIEARKRSTRKGAFKHTEVVSSGDRHYKACVKGRCSRKVLVRMGTPPKPPVPPAEATSVTLTGLSSSSVEAGQAFTVSGSASGNLQGRTVAIQAHGGTAGWGTVGTATVSGGQWSGTATVTTAGKAVPVRAVFEGAIGLSSSESTAATLAVYGWYYLYDGPPDEVASNDVDYSSYSVNGVTYAKSLSMYGGTGWTNYGEYNLGRACTRFFATVGFSDTSSTAIRSTGTVIVDSVRKWSQSGIALGQAHVVDLDVTGGLRLRLENTETSDGSGYLVYGDARALCAF